MAMAQVRGKHVYFDDDGNASSTPPGRHPSRQPPSPSAGSSTPLSQSRPLRTSGRLAKQCGFGKAHGEDFMNQPRSSYRETPLDSSALSTPQTSSRPLQLPPGLAPIPLTTIASSLAPSPVPTSPSLLPQSTQPSLPPRSPRTPRPARAPRLARTPRQPRQPRTPRSRRIPRTERQPCNERPIVYVPYCLNCPHCLAPPTSLSTTPTSPSATSCTLSGSDWTPSGDDSDEYNQSRAYYERGEDPRRQREERHALQLEEWPSIDAPESPAEHESQWSEERYQRVENSAHQFSERTQRDLSELFWFGGNTAVLTNRSWPTGELERTPSSPPNPATTTISPWRVFNPAPPAPRSSTASPEAEVALHTPAARHMSMPIEWSNRIEISTWAQRSEHVPIEWSGRVEKISRWGQRSEHDAWLQSGYSSSFLNWA